MKLALKALLFLAILFQDVPRLYASGQHFSDVPPTFGEYESIDYLSSIDILQGYPDHTFRPNDSINRAELLKILGAGFHKQEIGNEGHCFPDVNDEWFAPYVCMAKRLGWVQGYSDGTFRPSQALNRAEGIKILAVSLGLDVSSFRLPSFVDVKRGDWFAPFVAKATEREIYEWASSFEPAAPLVRWQLSQWVFNALVSPAQEKKEWSANDLRGNADGVCSDDEMECYGEQPDVTCWSRHPDCQFEDVLLLAPLRECAERGYFTLRARDSISVSCVPTQ